MQRRLSLPKIAILPQMLLQILWIHSLRLSDSRFVVYQLCFAGGIVALLIGLWRDVPLTKRQNIGLALASVGFSLAVIMAEYRLFLPLTVNFLSKLGTFLGGCSMTYSILKMLYTVKYPAPKLARKMKPLTVFSVSAFLCAAVYLVVFFLVNYPGILTYDSQNQISQVFTGEYHNANPIYHTWLMYLIITPAMAVFHNGNAAVATYCVFQILVMSSIFAYVITTLYQGGVSRKILLIVQFWYMLMPFHILYSFTVWKDILFSGCTALLCTAIFRICNRIGSVKFANEIVLVIALLGYGLMRNNGMLALGIILVIFLIVRYYKHEKLLFWLTAGVFLLCLVLTQVLPPMLGVEMDKSLSAMCLPIQQISRVVWEGGQLTKEQTDLLSHIADLENVRNSYAAHIADPVKLELMRVDNWSYVEENPLAFLKLYLELGVTHPGAYLRAWIDLTRGYWNGGYDYWIWVTGPYYNLTGFDLTSVVNSARASDLLSKYLEYFTNTKEYPLLSLLVSVGLHFWMIVAGFGYCIFKKRRDFIYLLPVLCVIFTLLLGTPVFCEFRYGYCIFTALPIAVLGSFCFTKAEVKEMIT